MFQSPENIYSFPENHNRQYSPEEDDDLGASEEQTFSFGDNSECSLQNW